MSDKKRERSANFTEDEKMKFLRILQRKGQVIISKVTSHDQQTNRLKEKAWAAITKDLNACGAVLRTSYNLQRLWQKLKTEVKSYKSQTYNEIYGSGGPAKKIDDPVLELVAEITGCGSSKINFDVIPDLENETNFQNSNLSEGFLSNSNKVTSYLEVNIDIGKEASQQETNDRIEKIELKKQNNQYFKRRRPDLDTGNDELSGLKAKHIRLYNNVSTARLRTENRRQDLIELQKQQMIELHALKMKQEQLKTHILETILEKIKDEKPMDHLLLNAINAFHTS